MQDVVRIVKEHPLETMEKKQNISYPATRYL